MSTSQNLGLTLQNPGDNSGVWGNITNNNLQYCLEQAISGSYTQVCTGGTDALGAIATNASSNARNAYIKLTGTGGGTVTVSPVSPSGAGTITKLYFVSNATSGAITFSTVSGTGVSVPAGATYILYCDGTNIVSALTANTATTIAAANPTASLGLTAINGSAATFMRSDAAPALDVTITPTWTGAHIWSAATTFNGTSIFGGSATFNAAFSATSTAGFSGAVTFTSTTNPTMNDGAGTQFAVGFREIPQVAKTATYTVVLSDSGKHVYYTTISTSTAVVIPVNASVAFPIGTVLTFINNGAAGGILTFAPQGSDTFILAGTGTSGSRSLARYGIATATKIALSGGNSTWYFSGTGVS